MATMVTEVTGRARGVAHACAACGGPVGRGPAEELWFYTRVPHARHTISTALARAGAAPTLDGNFVKVAVGGGGAPPPPAPPPPRGGGGGGGGGGPARGGPRPTPAPPPRSWMRRPGR